MEVPVKEAIVLMLLRAFSRGGGRGSHSGFGVYVEQTMFGVLVRIAPVLVPRLYVNFRHHGKPEGLILPAK